jgi:hypothetical protein
MPRARTAVVPAFALAGWTVFVWTTRIGNIWRDDAAGTGSKVASTALALSFTVLAVAVAVAAWRRAWAALRPAVLGLAAWTTGVWVVRSVTIVAGDRSVGFKVVHGVLAVVSIALAAWAARSVQSPRPASDTDSRYVDASRA